MLERWVVAVAAPVLWALLILAACHGTILPGLLGWAA